MTVGQNNRKLITAVSTGLIFTLLAFYYGYIERFMPWWCQMAAALLIVITLIMMVIYLVKQVISIFKNRKELNRSYFYPIVIYLTAILAPTGSWEGHLSAVKFRACYEGTQSQTTIEFREDHTFELHATGVFLYNDWMMGKWTKNGDTLKLKWSLQPARTLGNTIMIDSGYLKPIGESADPRFRRLRLFYIGYCKGEN